MGKTVFNIEGPSDFKIILFAGLKTRTGSDYFSLKLSVLTRIEAHRETQFVLSLGMVQVMYMTIFWFSGYKLFTY